MRRRLVVSCVAAVAVAALGLPMAMAQSKAKRPQVAVMDFDYGTLDPWWGSYDIGKGVADQITDALVNDQTFRVIERKKIDAVLAEQDFARSDRADPSQAKIAKVGKALSVKYIIAGSITKFATEARGGGVRVKGIGLGGKKTKSEVKLTARLIDTTTGEIMIAAKGVGESSKGGGFDFSKGGFGVGTNSDEWRASGLGDAQERAAEDVVKQIVARIANLE